MLKKLFRRKTQHPFQCATSRGPEYILLDDKAIDLIQATGQYITKQGIVVAYANEMGEQEIGLLTGKQFQTWLSNPPSNPSDRLRFVRHCMLKDTV